MSGGGGGGAAGAGDIEEVIAGAGMTGGGASGSVTLNVVANADGSIVVNANDIQVGVAFAPVWTGTHTWEKTDAGTTTVLRDTMRRQTSGTAAAGLGIGVSYEIETDGGGAAVEAGRWDCVWSDPAAASKDSSFALSAFVANTLAEVARFGAGAALPDVDYSFSVGRALIDSRTADAAYFSHRDQTSSVQYAVLHSAAGATLVNCTNGQTLTLRHNNGVRMTINSTGLAFFTATPVVQQTIGAVTNSVTAGGVDGTIANYTDLTIYANDAAAIRNDIYQLARSVAQITVALRNYALGA